MKRPLLADARRTDTASRRDAGVKGAAHASARPARVGSVDALRGIAILLMFAYHFAFDLRHYGVWRADFENDPLWLSFRALIVSMFMTLVGISLVLADHQHASTLRHLTRVAWIAAGALAATLASYLLFPASFIYFGILHCIAVTSLLAWPLRRHPMLAMTVGVAVLVAGFAWSSPLFDTRALSWIGFTTHKPVTEDYVPLVPWSAATFIGMAAGHALLRGQLRALEPLGQAPAWIRWMGRHALAIYLVHQPVLLGLLGLFLHR